jgi:hypothetical protein
MKAHSILEYPSKASRLAEQGRSLSTSAGSTVPAIALDEIWNYFPRPLEVVKSAQNKFHG